MRLASSAFRALIGAFVLAAPIPALAQPSTRTIEELASGIGEVEPSPIGLLHRASGYIFPRTLGEVPARKSTAYGPGDVDVYYTLYGGGNGDGWVSLFVYPANITITEEVANVGQSIVSGMSGHRVGRPAEIGAPPSGVEEGWFEGAIEGKQIVTGYRVVRIGDWFIKARVSVPIGADEAVLKRVGAALTAIDFAPSNLKTTDVAKAAAQ